MQNSMRLYELVLVLKASTSEADRKKLLTGIKKSLGDIKVAKEEEWGQKPLSYPIKKEAAGIYHMLQLEGDPSTGSGLPAGFETGLIRNDNVLRHLLVRMK